MQYKKLLFIFSLLISVPPISSAQESSTTHQKRKNRIVKKRSFISALLVNSLKKIGITVESAAPCPHRIYLGSFYVDSLYDPYPIFEKMMLSASSYLPYDITTLRKEVKRAWSIKMLQSICKIGFYLPNGNQYLVPIILSNQKLILELQHKGSQLKYCGIYQYDDFLDTNHLPNHLITRLNTLPPFYFAIQEIVEPINLYDKPIFIVVRICRSYKVYKITLNRDGIYQLFLMSRKKEVEEYCKIKLTQVKLGKVISDATGNIEIVMQIGLKMNHIIHYYTFSLIEARKEYLKNKNRPGYNCYVGQELSSTTTNKRKADYTYGKITLIYYLGIFLQQEKAKKKLLPCQDRQIYSSSSTYYAQDAPPLYQKEVTYDSCQVTDENLATAPLIPTSYIEEVAFNNDTMNLPLVIYNTPLEQLLGIYEPKWKFSANMPLEIVNNMIVPLDLSTLPSSIFTVKSTSSSSQFMPVTPLTPTVSSTPVPVKSTSMPPLTPTISSTPSLFQVMSTTSPTISPDPSGKKV